MASGARDGVDVRPGEPSETARGAAALRHGFERVSAPYGDAAADQMLQRDVGGDVDLDVGGSMMRYLQLRTAYFDTAAVDAIADGIGQIVAIGAGYDGRCLRYDNGDVQWYEVDEAVTQADKRARLGRLGIATPMVGFTPVDLATEDLALALDHAGQDSSRPTLFTCEGVVGYVTVEALADLLSSARDRAAPGSRIAIEIPVAADSDAEVARQGEIQSVVTALGEAMPPSIRREDLLEFVTGCGWLINTANDPLGQPIITSRKIPAFIDARAH